MKLWMGAAALWGMTAMVSACTEGGDAGTTDTATGGTDRADGGDSEVSDGPESVVIETTADCDARVSFESLDMYGDWYATNAACDEGLPGEQTPSCDESPFPMQEGREGCVAHTEGGGFPNSESEGWGWALIGVALDTALDACDWGGIGTVTSGTPVTVKIVTPATNGDSDHFGAVVSAGRTVLGWDDLRQEGWGAPQTFDCSEILGFIFQASNPVSFDFSIHEISLVAKGHIGADGPSTDIPDGREPGAFLGEMNNTYYWFLEESDYDADEEATLVDERCDPLVTVDADFAADVCLEGSGRLKDGTLVNLIGTCACGYPCGDAEEGTCFYLPDPEAFPWGVGSASNPLEPLVSIAANDLPFGQLLYLPVFDGSEIPALDGLGGAVHDGCFRVDDEGYSFGGDHLDIFVGTSAMFNEIDGRVPTFSGLDVYDGAAHCGDQ